MRVVQHQYRDPLDHIWLDTAKRIGFSVFRTDEAFAHSDGKNGIHIAHPKHLDEDDCLAQMIFHELCHSLVEGPDAFEKQDWGLVNDSKVDVSREHGCLRVQATLADRYGLRHVLAPTTEFRVFYDALGDQVLEDNTISSIRLAKSALRLAHTPPWSPHLHSALAATSQIIQISSAFRGTTPSPLLRRFTSIPSPHSSSLPGSSSHPCGQCGWRNSKGICLQSQKPVAEGEPGCERFEAVIDCESCGACCRAAYHSVTVDETDPVVTKHPHLIVTKETYIELKRKDDRCVALNGDLDNKEPFHCSIYDDRPRCCRDFERGGEHCLSARRRLGLSL